MTFINGQQFVYLGRQFVVISKWNQKGPSSEWPIDFQNMETGEVVTRKLGYLTNLYKEGKIK